MQGNSELTVKQVIKKSDDMTLGINSPYYFKQITFM